MRTGLHIFVFFIFTYILISCSPVRYVAVHDTTIVKEVIRDTIIKVSLPVESESVVVDDTTSTVSTSLAESTVTVSGGRIFHSIKNIKDTLSVKAQYVDKSTIVTKEIPTPVEVEKKVIPKWCWWCLGFTILIVLLTLVRLYVKLKPV